MEFRIDVVKNSIKRVEEKRKLSSRNPSKET